jgi:hypothetical protein
VSDLSPLDSEDRFVIAVSQAANVKLEEEGLAWMDYSEIVEIGKRVGLTENRTEHAVTKLEEGGRIWEKGARHYDAVGLAILFEEAVDRRKFRERNALRREVLEHAARADDRGTDLTFHEDSDQFIDRSWLELMVAVRLLAFYDLVDLDPFMGHNFNLSITHHGYELVRDETALARTLPVTTTEDEEAHASVASDVLPEVIRSCEEMLESRGWTGALTELRRGDQQFQAGHWVDAISEYYAALESGLKHGLDEAPAAYSAGIALRDLARTAADAGLVPVNYQSLFGFIDSIRSPRRHGRGNRPDEVEVGPAEALLMSNHVRALLVYLGQRPA